MKSLFCTTAIVALTAHAHAQFAYDEAEQDVSDQVSACLVERGLPPDATSPFCPERDNRVLATITTFGDRNPEGAGAVSILDAETIASIAADHRADRGGLLHRLRLSPLQGRVGLLGEFRKPATDHRSLVSDRLRRDETDIVSLLVRGQRHPDVRIHALDRAHDERG